ncbi:uncharacterized protein LOC124653237 [Lolium rigidum]|uniref:uncharacterized protein LOC124653237 n=1 Tax=Lolium rigidum TaxID=89674 RepID=UPI001F5D4B61|nr:uncharacterized protein LOC124653237 [Lolium rigidum]
MAAESWWCWLSSGMACFLFFNAIVCVVAVLSWGRGGGDATLSARRKRLTRSASSMVMERLRSMSTIFSFNYSVDEYDSITPPASHPHHLQGYYCASQEERGEEMSQAASEEEPEPLVAVAESMTTTMARPKPSVSIASAAAAEVCAATSTTGNGKEEPETQEEMTTPDPAAAKGAATLEGLRKWKVPSIVERRAFAEIEEKAEVNARAERFIRQFREDLKLERLKSILTRKC